MASTSCGCCQISLMAHLVGDPVPFGKLTLIGRVFSIVNEQYITELAGLDYLSGASYAFTEMSMVNIVPSVYVVGRPEIVRDNDSFLSRSECSRPIMIPSSSATTLFAEPSRQPVTRRSSMLGRTSAAAYLPAPPPSVKIHVRPGSHVLPGLKRTGHLCASRSAVAAFVVSTLKGNSLLIFQHFQDNRKMSIGKLRVC